MVVDFRFLNSRVIPIAWFPHFPGNKPSAFGSMDAFKGFWQFSMAKTIQDVYCLMTDLGTFSVTKLIQ
jgi:hypothetical protein